MKMMGVNRILSVSAVGSLKEDIEPLDMVLVDQFVDRTNQGRETTFFGEGIVAHISFAEPVCAELREVIIQNNKDLGIKIHEVGTYVNMEGPAFSTKAESFLYRQWGMDIIGMTNMPEARLAREAGICYSTIAMVTDYDCWYENSEVGSVSVEMVLENLSKNIENVKKILHNTIRNIHDEPGCMCKTALKDAIVTNRELVPRKIRKKLRLIIGD